MAAVFLISVRDEDNIKCPSNERHSVIDTNSHSYTDRLNYILSVISFFFSFVQVRPLTVFLVNADLNIFVPSK